MKRHQKEDLPNVGDASLSDLREPSERTKEEIRKRYVHSQEYVERLAGDRDGRNDFFDKAMISLSGGGFAVSLVGIRIVEGNSTIALLEALPIAWVLWGLSCASLLASYKMEARLLDRIIAQVGDDLKSLKSIGYLKTYSDSDVIDFLNETPLPTVTYRTRCLTWIGVILCIAAYGLTCSFGILNLWAIKGS